MQITCPKGCHQKPDWSYSVERREFFEGGEIFEGIWGETCDQCGEHVLEIDPEAEKDYRRFEVREQIRFILWVIALASIAAVALWVAP